MSAPTLAEVNAVLAQCGCCEHPRCCPPLLECRSLTFQAGANGWDLPPDSTDSDPPPLWQATKYLRKTTSHASYGSDNITSVSNYPGSGSAIEYTSYTRVDTRSYTFSEWVDRAFSAALGCLEVSGVFFEQCSFGGTLVTRYYAPVYSGGTWTNYLATEFVQTEVSVAGETTEEFTAWEAESAQWDIDHPDFAAEEETYATDFAAWQADYTAYEAEYAQWEIDYDAWLTGGEVGPEPTVRDAPGEPPAPPPRPLAPGEFYPPCTRKTTVVRTNWKHEMSGGVAIISLVPGTEEVPNPLATHTIGTPGGVTGPTVYSEPVTLADFKAAAEAWAEENSAAAFAATELAASDSGACAAGFDLCGASKFYSSGVDPWRAAIYAQVFRYRWKLNKCCGYSSIQSGWREVYWPKAYLDWLDLLETLGSDDPVPPPPVDLDALATKKQWLWTGTPPLCPEDSADSSASAPPVDPFDHEPMWSPWSAPVKVPDGQEGRIGLRNYFQICYATLRDFMPAVTGALDFSDDLPDAP